MKFKKHESWNYQNHQQIVANSIIAIGTFKPPPKKIVAALNYIKNGAIFY
jgi:hypothetical protein